MSNFSADLLEFDALRGLVARYVRGPLGRAEIAKLEPRPDRAALEKSLGSISLAETPSNLAFGDEDFQSLFVTARTSVYRIRLDVKGSVQY